MVDREKAPLIQTSGNIPKIDLMMETGRNGMNFYFIDMGEEEVSRIDIIIKAGKYEQEKNLISSFTNLMLREGAGKLSAEEIAEDLDFHGASMQTAQSNHFTYISVYTLNKYFAEITALLEQLVKRPNFPPDKLEKIKKREKNKFIIESEKVGFLASNELKSMLFGERHPYGKKNYSDDFDKIEKEDLIRFHRDFYHSGNAFIFLSGNIKPEMKNLIKEKFGNEKWGSQRPQPGTNFEFSPAKDRIRIIDKKDALQNAIRIGFPSIPVSHPDYYSLRISNTILGDYFGSRLMSNIREDKGYTYGIYSSLVPSQDVSYLSIGTQADINFTNPIIQETEKEIERLKLEKVGEDELKMVKNYLLGSVSRTFDGVFSIADVYTSLIVYGLPFDFYEQYAQKIKEITSEEILETAKKYFPDKDRMYTVIAGKYKLDEKSI